MNVSIDLELIGLGDALKTMLPDGVKPTAVQLTSTALRLDARAFGWKNVALTAAVESAEGSLRIHGFEIDGAMGFAGTVLDGLRRKIPTVDQRWMAFRVKGAQNGESITVTWG